MDFRLLLASGRICSHNATSSKMLFVSAFIFALALAQRPNNASICDYYAETLYGTNSSATQSKLIKSIVTLAYIGGSSLPNATDITGILNPGTFNGIHVDLHPWFDGSILPTNVNNEAAGVNWVDEGIAPLEQFLTGKTSTIQLNSTTNEY